MNRPTTITAELGKIPPQAIDLEEAVLGAIMIESKAIYLASKIIQPEHFYSEINSKVCRACYDLYNDSKPVDILTVTEQLRSKGELQSVGGPVYISRLTDRVASSANLEYHCRIVIEKYLQREVIRINSTSIKAIYEDETDVFSEIDGLQTSLHGLVKNLSGTTDLEINQVVDQLTEIVESNHAGNVPGVPTGVSKYDQYSGGQQKGNLIIYAGRPGMGKSARMVNEAYAQLNAGYKVVIHSIEMTRVEVSARLMGLHLNIPPSDILKKKIDREKYKVGAEWLKKQPIKIYIGNKLNEIERETAIMVTQKKCDIVYIDYLQLIDSGQFKTIDNVSKSSIGLKQLAKKMDIPVVALAQLSRAVETRGGDKKPILSDLRDSGQIEQDADVVEFLYRPEYYEIHTDEDGNSLLGKIYFINGKLRGGQPFQTIELNWNGPLNRIYEGSQMVAESPFKIEDLPKDDVPF